MVSIRATTTTTTKQHINTIASSISNMIRMNQENQGGDGTTATQIDGVKEAEEELLTKFQGNQTSKTVLVLVLFLTIVLVMWTIFKSLKNEGPIMSTSTSTSTGTGSGTASSPLKKKQSESESDDDEEENVEGDIEVREVV